MDALYSSLSGAQTSEEVENAVKQISVEQLAALSNEDASALLDLGKTINENEEIVNNAQIRRRMKRFITMIESRSEVAEKVQNIQKAEKEAAFAAASTLGQGSYVNSNKFAPIVPVVQMGMEEATAAFNQATTSADIEAILNGLQMPAKSECGHSAEFEKHRESLHKAILQLIESGGQMITSRVKRRATRLEYILLSDKDRAIRIANKPPPQAPPVKRQREPELVLPPARDLDESLSGLGKAATPEDVDVAIADVNGRSSGMEDEEKRANYVKKIEEILANEELINNAKIRRKVKRVLEAVQAGPIETQSAPPVPQYEAPQKQAKQAIQENRQEPAQKKSLRDVINSIENASNPEEVETALTTMPLAGDIDIESDDCKDLLTKLETLSNNVGNGEGGPSDLMTAPGRRRLKRAIATLSAESVKEKQVESQEIQEEYTQTTNAAAGGDDAEDKLIVVHNPPPGAPLEEAIAAVQAATDATSLEAAVKLVKPGSGNMKSRRKLRRAITFIMADEAKGIGTQLNSKQKRQVTRTLEWLEGKANSGVKEVLKSELKTLVGEEVYSKITGEKDDSNKRQKVDPDEYNAPLVLFFGQLSYKTNEEDLERHLKANGVATSEDTPLDGAKNRFSIRMLTDKGSDGETRSKGMAFVQVQDPTELHKCLGLHHTILHGRRINVEKSCGGRNKDARQAKLAGRRQEQESAVRSKIDEVLADYESRDVLSVEGLGSMLAERVYSYTAQGVSEILEQFSQRPKEHRSRRDLDLLMDEHDQKVYGKKGANFEYGAEFRDLEDNEESMKVVAEDDVLRD